MHELGCILTAVFPCLNMNREHESTHSSSMGSSTLRRSDNTSQPGRWAWPWQRQSASGTTSNNQTFQSYMFYLFKYCIIFIIYIATIINDMISSPGLNEGTDGEGIEDDAAGTCMASVGGITKTTSTYLHTLIQFNLRFLLPKINAQTNWQPNERTLTVYVYVIANKLTTKRTNTLTVYAYLIAKFSRGARGLRRIFPRIGKWSWSGSKGRGQDAWSWLRFLLSLLPTNYIYRWVRDRLIDWLIDCLIGWLIAWLVDWLLDCLIDSLIRWDCVTSIPLFISQPSYSYQCGFDLNWTNEDWLDFLCLLVLF